MSVFKDTSKIVPDAYKQTFLIVIIDLFQR